MQRSLARSITAALILVLVPLAVAASSPAAVSSSPLLSSVQPFADSPTPAPVLFIENVGQYDDGARFVVYGEQGAIFLAPDAIWITLLEEPPTPNNQTPNEGLPEASANQPIQGVNLRLTFSGENPNAQMEGFNPLDANVSYFIGDDPNEWKSDVPVWGGVRYVDIYPGMNLEITSEGGRWAWRLVAQEARAFAPGMLAMLAADNVASGESITLQVEGAEALTTDGDQLHITTEVGEFSLPLLEAVSADGSPLPVENELLPTAAPTSSETPALAPIETSIPEPTLTETPTQPETPTAIPSTGANGGVGVLAAPVVKPVNAPATDEMDDLIFSTFLGGSAGAYGQDIFVDATGNIYVAGFASSVDFPITSGVFGSANGASVFVAKVTTDGSAVTYVTFIGSSGYDVGTAIDVDAGGRAHLTGFTAGPDFPTTDGALDLTYNGGGYDVFVSRLSADGHTLLYSTYLGGDGTEMGYGIVAGSDGSAYVVGATNSGNFPMERAYDPTLNGSYDVFVSRLSVSGNSLVYSTYLGGSDYDHGDSIVSDTAGNVYLTGYTKSTDFPKTSLAYDPTYNGDYDVYVTGLAADGSGLTYSTFIGGNGSDQGFAIAMDGNGDLYVTGQTHSSDYPTYQAADPDHNGGADVFVTKFSPGGNGLSYSTFIGHSGAEIGDRIAVDVDGHAYIAGVTGSISFPVTSNAFDRTYNGGYYDAFVTKLSADGNALEYSTFLGGNGIDYGMALTVHNGAAYISGTTGSSNFPVAQGAPNPGNTTGKAFVTKLQMGALPSTVTISITDSLGSPLPSNTLSLNSIGRLDPMVVTLTANNTSNSFQPVSFNLGAAAGIAQFTATPDVSAAGCLPGTVTLTLYIASCDVPPGQSLLKWFIQFHPSDADPAVTISGQIGSQTTSTTLSVPKADRPDAPDAGNSGPYYVGSAEYKFPGSADLDIDPTGTIETELWAKVWWPQDLFGAMPDGPLPLLVFMHGAHETCHLWWFGTDIPDTTYAYTGDCNSLFGPIRFSVVPNHEGFSYLAEKPASWGYIVVSINTNRGILRKDQECVTCAFTLLTDQQYIAARGRLLLKHLQLWYAWNTTGAVPAGFGQELQGFDSARFQGKVDFGNVGLMGHSRGGAGVRAAYYLYQHDWAVTPSWSERIPGLAIKGIFEIGPSDDPIYDPVDANITYRLNADEVAWNVLLPVCDGDIKDWQGLRPFDRMVLNAAQTPAAEKSKYAVWGANHNFYNTEWAKNDGGCIGSRNNIALSNSEQQKTALDSLLAFFRGNVYSPIIV